MDLEKYREQMSAKTPGRSFAEETLQNIKNGRSKSNIPFEAIAKKAGTFGLGAAVLVGVVAGAGIIGGAFRKPIPREDPSVTFDVLLSEESDPDCLKTIITDENGIKMTPLANPNHTLKVGTEDGRIALDENTTAEELVACGVVLNCGESYVGWEQVCRALRDVRAGLGTELIISALPDEESGCREYIYEKINADATSDKKVYKHNGEHLSTITSDFSWYGGNGAGYAVGRYYNITNINGYFFREGLGDKTIYVGMGYGDPVGDNWFTIPSISDMLDVTGLDGETARQRYFENLLYVDGVNVMYNGKMTRPELLNDFVAAAESGEASYFSTTLTDITKTDEYEERFYAIERIGGGYRVFTMTDGFEGRFNTQYFDSFTIEDNELVFDNGDVRYSFPMSGEHNEEENSDSRIEYSIDMAQNPDKGFEKMTVDPEYIYTLISDPNNCFEISDEYSDSEAYAIRVISADDGERIASVYDEQTEFLYTGTRPIKKLTLAAPVSEGKYKFSPAAFEIDESKCDIREMPDGNSYFMLPKEIWGNNSKHFNVNFVEQYSIIFGGSFSQQPVQCNILPQKKDGEIVLEMSCGSYDYELTDNMYLKENPDRITEAKVWNVDRWETVELTE